MKNQQHYSIKEKILISFSFWPTLIIGVALGMTISLLLILKIPSFEKLMTLTTYLIIGLIIVGVVARVIVFFIGKNTIGVSYLT